MASTPKPKKLCFREQKEWEGIDAAITAAEATVTARLEALRAFLPTADD